MSRPVVFTIDDKYVRPLCVALRSLAVANAGRLATLRVVVLYDSLSAESSRQIQAFAADNGIELELRPAELGKRDYPLWGWISPAAYLRLAIDDVLVDFDSVLYVDSDTLIVGELSFLLNTDLGGTPIAAVRDPLNPVIGCGVGLFGWKDLGLDGRREYFNSGVMVFDLPACREKEVFSRALWLVENKPECVLFPDQDALNWAADDGWVRLDRCWNTLPVSAIAQRFSPLPCQHEMLPLDVLRADEATARILHYAGPLKPWNDDFPDGDLRDRYLTVLKEVG